VTDHGADPRELDGLRAAGAEVHIAEQAADATG
jgi:hypothetical protein